jgi:OHCU decarboxylase
LFVERFGGIYEHSRWVAEAAYDRGLGPEADTAAGLSQAMAAGAAAGTDEQKRALIAAHPDLAGRLARAKQLTADSTKEQASAGLDQLSAEELSRFTTLNDAYKQKFGFPFIIAVKGKRKEEIVAAFERRLANDPAAEFATALAEIDRIGALRLAEILP